MTPLDDLLAACNDLAADTHYATKTRTLARRLGLWAETVQPTPTPSPTPTYLFHDEFDGAAGTPPDTAKWVNLDGITYGGVSAAKASNAFHDGNGNMILRVTREPWQGRSFAGALIGTYQYQTGWPPKPVLASWPVPFRYEVRFRLPVVAGAWFGPGWNQNVDRAIGYVELDVGESRGTFPTLYGCNMHTWNKDATGKWVDTPSWGQNATGEPGAWHALVCDARADGTTFALDGVPVGTGFGVSGRFGVLLHNVIADVASWGSGGMQPAATDPGPWDMAVDYVRVSAL